MTFKKGDKVIPSRVSTKDFLEFFTEDWDEEDPGIVGFVDENGTCEVIFTDKEGGERFQFVPSERLKLDDRKALAGSDNSSHLVLVKAEFLDETGTKVVIKRSKCRHYYLKYGGQNQSRVSIARIHRMMERQVMGMLPGVM